MSLLAVTGFKLLELFKGLYKTRASVAFIIA